MTTLDPSHLPWLTHSDDPTKGAAVHTSVRRPANESAQEVREGGSGSGSSEESSDVSSTNEIESESEAHDADELAWIRRRKAEHKSRRRQRRDEIRAQGRLPTLPLPDVRFEQSYLMSIQPFIHPVPSPRASTSAAAAAAQSPSPDVDGDGHLAPPPTSTSKRDKRRRVEESFALVADPAHSARVDGLDESSNPIDALFVGGHGSPAISIDWGQIAYVTLRDQVLSPLVQGALWAVGGILLGQTWTYLKARAPQKQSLPGRSIWERLFGQAGLTRKSQRM